MEVVGRTSDSVTLRGMLPMTARDAFGAFADPERLTAWWPEEAEVDLRVGGRYRLFWPQQSWTLRGRYLEIDAPHRLRFTWSWDHESIPERAVTLDFADLGARTELTIDHTCGSAEEGQSYIDGWQFFLSRLVS